MPWQSKLRYICVCVWSIKGTQSLITHTCSGILLMKSHWRIDREIRNTVNSCQCLLISFWRAWSVHALLSALSQNFESMYISCQQANHTKLHTLTPTLLLVSYQEKTFQNHPCKFVVRMLGKKPSFHMNGFLVWETQVTHSPSAL